MTPKLATFMSSIIHFGCPECSRELEASSDGPDTLECAGCGQSLGLGKSPSLRTGQSVDVCAVCGHPDMYVQKDFNRNLGLGIVVLGVMASLVFFAANQPFLSVAALVLMAVIDGLIYLSVGEVTVCYSCHAIYRGFAPNPRHKSFNLQLLERYGGRTPRR